MAYFDKFLIKSLVFSLSLIMVVTMIPTNTFAVDSVSKSSIDIESDDSFDDDIVDIDTMRDMIDNGFEGYVDEDEDIYESDSNSNSSSVNSVQGNSSEVIEETIIKPESESEFIEENSKLEVESQEVVIDKKTGEVEIGSDVKLFEEVFDTKLPKKRTSVIEVVEDADDFEVLDETSDEIVAINPFASNQLIVDFELDEDYGADKVIVYEGQTILNFSDETLTKEAYEKLLAKYGQEHVLIDSLVEADAVDWGYNYMQFPNGINHNKAIGANKNNILVAVVDSGFNIKHKIYNGEKISKKSRSFTNQAFYVDYPGGHGTGTAGLVADSTPSNVSFLLLKHSNGKTSKLSDTLRAMEYAANNGAHVINCSFGGFVSSSKNRQYENNFYKKISSKSQNPIIVASSGNDGKNGRLGYYPSDSPYTISVGSINKKGGKSKFSNYGSALDFVAPGEACVVASSSGGYKTSDGTSYSAPYISAAVAILKSRSPKMTKTQVINSLKSISVDLGGKGKDSWYGWGVPKFKKYTPPQTTKKFSSVTVQTPVRYTGKDISPKVTVKSGNTVLSSSYYTVNYPNGRKTPGTHTARVVGKNGYSGTYDRSFFIERPFSSITVQSPIKYTGKDVSPKITVKNGNTVVSSTYYTVSYPDGRKTPGTHKVVITAKNGFTGTYNRTFRIDKEVVKQKFTSIAVQSPVTYTGKEVNPKITVKSGNSVVSPSNYSVSYPDGRTNVGTHKVVITAKNNYEGTYTKTFVIDNPFSSVYVESPLHYTEKAVYPRIVVKQGNRVLSSDYYTVSYPKDMTSLGPKNITITARNGFTGTYNKKIYVVPAPVTLYSGKYNGAAYIMWSNSKPANYQVGFFDSKYARVPYRTVVTDKPYYYCDNNKGKIYYRVRVYGYQGKYVYYSDWSNGAGWYIK